MSKDKDLIPVQVKRVGTVYIKSTPRLRRLRAEIGRLVWQKKRVQKLRANGRLTETEYRQRKQATKERLKALYADFEQASSFAVEQQLREITRCSPKTYSGALFESGAPTGRRAQYRSIPAGLPSLGKKR